MTRVEALEAVAKKAAAWHRWASEQSFTGTQYALWEALHYALDALDALPAAPTQAQGETVEVWTHAIYGESVCLSGARFADPGWKWRGRIALDTSNPPIRATVAGGGE
jgi:hypothetical protein